MLVAIDAGNTETKVGCFAGKTGDLLNSWRATTDARRTADEYGTLFSQLFATSELSRTDVEAVVIASVVPKLDAALHEACTKYLGRKPVFFEAQSQKLMPIETDRPGEVGADLVACAIGAKELYGLPLIVISYGTATVFMAINNQGQYLGVAMAPGIQISIDALVERAAKLPQIALEAPGHALGTDTISALQSGIVYGFVGQTEALITRFRKEMGVDARVIATGGLAAAIAPHTKLIDEVNPQLSLIGLQRFYRSLKRPLR